MNQFLPTAPLQRDFHNPLVVTHELQVAQWLDHQPLGEPAVVVPALLEAVDALNREPLPAKDRIKLLERFRSVVATLFDNWEQLLGRSDAAATAQRLEAEERFGTLLLALAGGYKIVVRDARSGKRPRIRDSVLHLAVYRAIELTSDALIDSFRRYAVVAPHSFRELHQLQQFASERGLADDAAVIGKDQTTPYTPGTLYMRAMLVAAADPYRLGTGEAMMLYRLIIRYAQMCRIEARNWDNPDGRFFIDLTSDGAPRPCAKAEAPRAGGAWWVLDTNPMREAVRGHIDDAGERARVGQELQLLRRLLPNLKAPPRRRSERQHSAKQLRVATGLAAAHLFLTDEGRTRVIKSPQDSAYGIEVYDADTEEQMAHVLEPWKVINESARGYLLTRRHALDEALQVGEVLGLFPMTCSNTTFSCELALVRWIRRGKEGWVQIGIEVLPGRPAAVDCRPTDPEAPPYAETRAIYLYAVAGLALPATLLGRPSLYQRDREIALEMGGRHGRARIGSLIMQTPRLARMALKPPE